MLLDSLTSFTALALCSLGVTLTMPSLASPAMDLSSMGSESDAQYVTPSDVLATAGSEVGMSLTASFRTQNPWGYNLRAKADLRELVNTHLQHLLGALKSYYYLEKFNVDENYAEGIGAPRLPGQLSELKVRKLSRAESDEDTWEIFYTYEGRGLFLKSVSQQLIRAHKFEVPLPLDLDNYFDAKCFKDAGAYDEGDFFYFFDPYKSKCDHLRRAPLGQMVTILVSDLPRSEEKSAKLAKLRGDNGNGDLFSITLIQGADESARSSRDVGRIAFAETNQHLKSIGFEMKTIWRHQERPWIQFRKSVAFDGVEREVVIDHMFVDTSISKTNVTFAKFFQRAVLESDVIMYTGHSGLGGNLDLQSLEEKIGTPIRFSENKHQILYIDSCASYTYYLDAFRARRDSADHLDIITNAFASLYGESQWLAMELIENLTRPTVQASWPALLRRMENRLPGTTYLTNVGNL